MTTKKTLSVAFGAVVLALLFTSCGAVKKTLHPARYCVEKRCYRERKLQSIYCEPHHELTMYRIIREAAPLKQQLEDKERELYGEE